MTYISSEEKKSLLADLIDLAKSDGTVTMPEMTYLLWVAQKLDVSQSELTLLANGNRSTYRSVSTEQRLQQLHRMLNMVFVDGKVEADELETCKELAYQIGLDRSRVDALLDSVFQNPKTMLSFEDLKAKFEAN